MTLPSPRSSSGVSQAHAKDVAEFLTKLGIANQGWFELDFGDTPLRITEKLNSDHPYLRRMLHALAWVSFDHNRPSRGERRITTERREEYQDWAGPVTRKRVVKTGWCSPPSGGQDGYTGEYWFDSGGLDNAKTHVILTVNLGYREFDIDSQNVQKIMGDHNAGVRDRPQ